MKGVNIMETFTIEESRYIVSFFNNRALELMFPSQRNTSEKQVRYELFKSITSKAFLGLSRCVGQGMEIFTTEELRLIYSFIRDKALMVSERLALVGAHPSCRKRTEDYALLEELYSIERKAFSELCSRGYSPL